MNPTIEKELPNVTDTKETEIGSLGEILSICILDDEPAMVEALEQTIQQFGYSPRGTCDPQAALELIRTQKCRVVLCDVKMPGMTGLAFLEKALKMDPGTYVTLMSGFYSMEAAIDAIRQGAYDYLPKPIESARLKRTLDDLAELFRHRRRVHDLHEQLLDDLDFHGIVGRSPAMFDVFDLARKIARHYTSVLIVGQTGTGKELIAQAIHQMSPVSKQRFVVCNCSAMVDTLLESQLFGHVRGAFTGATDTRAGLFEYANGGTIFLDEIGETSPAMQAKLLRVIQNREIQRVGSPEVRRISVRLIDLRVDVLAGRFREDLFYRLSAIQIRVPSLIERLEDIPLLLNYFTKKYATAYQKQIQGLTRRAQTVLLQHSWPDNVRELENVISSAALVTTNHFIDVDDFPEHLQKPAAQSATDAWRPLPLDEIRKDHIKRVLEMCNGNRVRAAQMLGIGRTSLYRHLKRERRGGQPSAA
jgi:DNA-binding NtrC family response regulator